MCDRRHAGPPFVAARAGDEHRVLVAQSLERQPAQVHSVNDETTGCR